MLKVNVSSIRYVEIIDFPHEINWEDARNNVQLHDESLEVLLVKKEIGIDWTMLQVEGMSRQELIKRREESMVRFNKRKEIKFKAAQEKTYELDKETVKQQMKVEGHQRKHIKNEKKKLQD
jgi:hypothetical protein